MKQASLVCALLALIWGCGVDSSADSSAASAAAEAAPATVEVLSLTPTELILWIRATGVVAPARDVLIGTEVGGRVIARLRDAGEPVAAGEIVLRLDPEPAEIALARAAAALEIANANAAYAESEWQRLAALHLAADLSDSEYDAAELAKRSARAAAQEAAATERAAQRALRETELRAPWAGALAAVLAEEGALVSAGQPQARLISAGAPRIALGLPASELRRIGIGASARVELVDEPGIWLAGVVREVGIVPDPLTRTYALEVELAEPRGLQAGLAARVEFPGERLQDALLIPQSAVVVRRGAKLAFVAEKGRAQLRTLVVGTRSGDQIQVLEGLTAEEHLIVMGHERLLDGDPVEVRRVR